MSLFIIIQAQYEISTFLYYVLCNPSAVTLSYFQRLSRAGFISIMFCRPALRHFYDGTMVLVAYMLTLASTGDSLDSGSELK